MAKIIDVSYPCDRYALGLRRAGVETVVRYYSRDSAPNAPKRLGQAEASTLAASGLRLCIVFEGRRGNDITYFDHDAGLKDGVYARIYAHHTIGQPADSAIYFGIDTDALHDEIESRVIPYFTGLAETFKDTTGEPVYQLGVYGSGAVCQRLLDAGLVTKTWLAQSKGWTGYDKFYATGRWTMVQALSAEIAGVKCDPNTAGAAVDIGDFLLSPAATTTTGGGAPAGPGASNAALKYVNARSGLHLRAGPGVEFNVLSLLPYGTAVHPLKTTGAWTSVDLQGDSAADGFVSSGFLSDTVGAAPVAPPAAAAATTPVARTVVCPDANLIPTLIAHGSSPEGIAAARVEARPAVPGYPTNGCAAHLSALLRQSGIDVPMTTGAGKLAARLEQRGWTRIERGGQRAGDVGVAFDETPPAGSDHVYLVIQAIGADQMSITDNQNDGSNTPHQRFASGKGKTPTDYFLRAA